MKPICGIAGAGLVLIAGWTAGCGDMKEDLATLNRKQEEQAASLARTVQKVEEMSRKLDAYEQRRDQAFAAAADQVIKERLGTQVRDEVARLVAQQGQNTESNLDARIAAIVAQQMQNAPGGRRGGWDSDMTPEERSAAWERRRKEMEDRHWGETAKSLNLNETQTAAMRSASDALRSAARDMAAKLQEAGKLDMDNMRQQGQLLRQQYEAQLSQILSAEQLENYRNQPRSMLRMMDFMLGREARRLERGGDGSPEP